jgi:hypothetical protein
MRFVVGVLACIGVGGLSLVLADPPVTLPGPASAPAPAASPTVPASPVAAAPAEAPAPPTTTAAAAARAPGPAIDAEEKRLLAAGYKVELRHGEKVYCRREEILGSRLGAVKNCGTAAELRTTVQETRDRIEQVQRQQVNPTIH